MAYTPTPEEALERARETQEARMQTIRQLAEARNSVEQFRRERDLKLEEIEAEYAELITAAERDDSRAYSAAQKAGWSDTELRKIGFADASKPTRKRRRRTAAAEQRDDTAAAQGDAANGEDGEDGEQY